MLPALKASTGWIELRIISEVNVALGVRGYSPILEVAAVKTGLQYTLYISAKSLAEPLERLRIANGGQFTGICLSIRKESQDPMSKYEVASGDHERQAS